MTTQENPVALVSGSSAGIGKVICQHLLASGYQVLGLARRETEIDHPAMVSLCVEIGRAHV